jgi:hypothetical protein
MIAGVLLLVTLVVPGEPIRARLYGFENMAACRAAEAAFYRWPLDAHQIRPTDTRRATLCITVPVQGLPA